MFWICENEEQLEKLSTLKPCYINIIPLNHNYHPILTNISLIYYKIQGKKGLIFPINHNDGFSLSIELIKEFLQKHPQIYVLDKKKILHYLGGDFLQDRVIDINLLNLEQTIIPLDLNHYKSIVANYIEGSFKSHPKLNSFIPITKHYEEQELIYQDIKEFIGKIPQNNYYNGIYTEVLYRIEKQGIPINKEKLDEHFAIKHPKFFIKDNKIYTQYNLYNFTSRPSNSFNGINFAALTKSDNTREFIEVNDGFLFDFDFDGYHLRLIGKLINQPFSVKSAHKQMGELYYGKEELSDEEYKEAKFISFRQMYGNIYKKYEHITFFKELKQYIKDLWEQTNKQGYLELIGGRKINLEEISEPNQSKLFNYVIVSMETYYNIISIKKVLDYLDNKLKSRILLYTYDSILLNYSQDTKEILKDVKSLLESDGFKVNASYGKDYANLKEIK